MNERDENTATTTETGRTTRGEVAGAPDRESGSSATDAAFLPDDRIDALREQWTGVQTGFVDDPRRAVQRAHELVSTLVNELTETFSRERGNLEDQWSRGAQADTEALRVALQRYRDFFDRLLGT